MPTHQRSAPDRNSVNSYVQFLTSLNRSWQELQAMDDADFEALFPVKTSHDQVLHEQLCSYFPHYQKELTKPGCTLLTLWQSYQEKHPEGYQYTQFVHYFRQWQKHKKVSGKLEHKAGEKVFVDFTGKKLSIVDRSTGEVKSVEVFVAILPASGIGHPTVYVCHSGTHAEPGRLYCRDGSLPIVLWWCTGSHCIR